jgi:curli biogenesis system outer membrane secretion channel CsgG
MNMNRYVQMVALFVFSSGLLATAGCQHSLTADPAEDYVKPTIAVMKFENRAPFPLGWNLSDGTADILVDRLMATRRFHVIERTEPDSVLREQRLQNSGDVLGRQPGRPLGRVRVLTVAECYSVAETTTGSPTSFQTGMRCRKAYNSVAANVAKR